MKTTSERPVFHNPLFLGGLVIAAAVFVLYSVAFGHNFLFDEENIILKNPLIRSFSNIPEIFTHGYFYFEGRDTFDWTQYYRPLALLTFAVDYHFWQYNPLGYNLTSTFFHITTSIFLFILLFRLTGEKLAAFLAALLYSVHTLHTEAVTYTASRGDLLGGLFLVLSLICYLDGKIWRTTLLYTVSLFAKESAILTPIYLLVFDLAIVKSAPKKLFWRFALFGAIAAAYLFVRKTWVPVPMGPPAHDAVQGLLRVLSMGGPFLNYWKALLWPEAFKFTESIAFAKNFTDARVVTTFIVLGITGILWDMLAKRGGLLSFGATFFLLAMAPYLHWIHFYPEWAEHYLYIPSLGLAVLLAVALKKILGQDKRIIALAMLIYFLFFGLFCVRTWQRNKAYDETRRFYTLLSQSDSPYAFYGYQNLARLDIEHGHWDEAIVPLRTAEMIEPLSDVTQNLLGLYYFHKKDWPKAAIHFERAYRASNGNLQFYLNAGTAYMQMGEYREAVEIFEFIQKKRPRYTAVYANLIAAYELSGKPDKASEWARVGIEKLSDSPSDAAVLSMAFVRLAFRQGWDETMRAELERIMRDYPEVYWYKDIAMLLQGKTSPSDFEKDKHSKYGHFGPSSEMYVLLALAIQKQWDALEIFTRDNGAEITRQAALHPLQQKELDRVRELCRENGVTLNI